MRRLKELREELDRNQKDMAIELDITQQAYSLYECGKRDVPTAVLQLLADRFNVNLNWLILGRGEMFYKE